MDQHPTGGGGKGGGGGGGFSNTLSRLMLRKPGEAPAVVSHSREDVTLP